MSKMTEPETLNPVQKRRLHVVIWQFLRSTLFFWVPILVFLAIANGVRQKGPLYGDVAILEAIHRLTTPFLTRLFIFITALGSPALVILAVGIAAAALYYFKRRLDALFLLFAAAGTAVFNVIFKAIFARPRPELWQHLVVENDYSFPSGHAMISSALALAVILLTWRTRYRWAGIIFGIVYVLAIGLSRLYLGVHFPSDVLGGWCISTLWIITLYRVFNRFRRQKPLQK